MKLYIDITQMTSKKKLNQKNTVQVRMVSQLMKECKGKVQIVLLNYERNIQAFRIVDQVAFVQRFENSSTDALELITSKLVHFKDMMAGELFLDVEEGWNGGENRSYLYDRLKSQKVTIATFIDDFGPMNSVGEYNNNAILQFTYYIGAVLEQSDLVFLTSMENRRSFENLQLKLQCKEHNVTVLNLVKEISQNISNYELDQVDSEVQPLRNKEYILCVSGQKPLRNEKELIAAMQENHDMNLGIQIAREHSNEDWDGSDGRIYWLNHFSVQTLMFLYEEAQQVVYTTVSPVSEVESSAPVEIDTAALETSDSDDGLDALNTSDNYFVIEEDSNMEQSYEYMNPLNTQVFAQIVDSMPTVSQKRVFNLGVQEYYDQAAKDMLQVILEYMSK